MIKPPSKSLINALRVLAATSFIGICHGAAQELDKSKLKEQPVEVKKTLKDWLKELGSPDFSTRKQAELALWSGGDASLKLLAAEVNSEDPEIRYRAYAIHERILAGITPDTDPKVLEVMAQIRATSDPREADSLSSKLYQLSAYRPLIYLYSVHPNAAVKEALLAHAIGVAPYVASQMLADQDFKGAETILKKLPARGTIASALAALYFYQNRIENEVALLEKNGGRNSEMMRALLVQNESWAELRKLAMRVGDNELLAQLDVKDGSAKALEQLVTNYYYERSRTSASSYQKLGYKLSAALANGDFKKADEWTEALYNINNSSTSRRKLVEIATPLLLNGSTKFVDDGIQRFYLGFGDITFRAYMVGFINASERPNMLLDLVGAPADRSELIKWVKKSVEQSEFADPQRPFDGRGMVELRRIYTVAELYNGRGERDLVKQILEPLFKRMKKVDINLVVKASNECCKRDMGWFIVDQIQGYTPNEIDRIYQSCFSNFPESLHDLWADLSKVEKKKAEVFEKLALLTGIVRNSSRYQVNQVNDELVKQVKGGKVEQELNRFDLLLELAEMRGDAVSALDLSAMLIEKAGDEERSEYEATRFDLLFGMQDWKAIDLHYQKLIKKNTTDTIDYAIWTIVLNKMGEKTRAEEKFKLLQLYAMNDKARMLSNTYKFLDHGLDDYAIKIIDKLLVSYSFDSEEYRRLVEHINLYEPLYIERHDWKKAYGIAQANKYLAMLDSSGRRSQSPRFSPTSMIMISNNADFTKGMSLLKTNSQLAKAYLKRCVRNSIGGGNLADHYFPALERAGLTDLHRESYDKVMVQYRKVMKQYPYSHNTFNSAAWLAAKCGYDLDEAEGWVKKSLEIAPYTSAYTDTLAEVHFAKGNRAKAIEVSKQAIKQTFMGKSILSSSVDISFSSTSALAGQLEHFKKDALKKR